MRELTREQLINLFASLSLKSGDGVLVHSAVQFLGNSQHGVGDYWDAFSRVLDIDPFDPQASLGTLAAPAFNFGFARGESYDALTTPSQGMGVFSEYIRQLPGAKRTSHPMQSFAVIGVYAEELSKRDTPGAFDPGSAFDLMLDLDFKLVLLGADIQAVSAVHYSEQRAQVPYRYWKDFTAPLRVGDNWETRTYRMFVRDLQMDPKLKLHPIQALLRRRGQWFEARLNYGWVSLCTLRNFITATDDLLKDDACILMETGN